MDSMYETLLGLPLFHGATYKKISDIIGKYKFHFLKFNDGDTIAEAGEPCTHIKSIVSGSARLTITNDTGHFKASQTIDAPNVIAPDFFFGRKTSYPGTAIAIGNVGIMQINKADYLNIINSDPVFLFNYLNILSMNAQLSTEGVLAVTSGSLKKRIAYWIIALTQRNGYDITIECNQPDLYTAFGVQQNYLATTLKEMQEHGIVEYTDQLIRVTDRRKLVDILNNMSTKTY